jgi:Flp pilus assembly pilin Flp
MMTAFFREERGQDIVEYALLLAFVVCAAAGLFITSTDSIAGIWSKSNQNLMIANQVAQS